MARDLILVTKYLTLATLEGAVLVGVAREVRGSTLDIQVDRVTSQVVVVVDTTLGRSLMISGVTTLAIITW